MAKTRALWAIATAAVFAGCDCDSGTTIIRPALVTPDASIDFGLVAVGDSSLQLVRLAAQTNVELSLKVKIVDDADGAFAIDGEVPELIPGNGFVDFYVKYTPPALGTHAATLAVETNDEDPVRGKPRILLSGQGMSPQIAVTPEVLELSAIACPNTARSPRCKDVQKVFVENAGEVDLTLGTLEIKPKGDGAVPPGLAFAELVSASRLVKGQKLEVKIQWKPASPAPNQPQVPADYEAVLHIPSNDPAKPLVEIPIRAHADPNTAPSACVDVLEVTRIEYRTAAGKPEPVQVGVSECEYRGCCPQGHPNYDPSCTPSTEILVRPGYTVKLTSRRKNANDELTNPCTVDPEGDELTYRWSVSTKPDESRAGMTPAGAAESGLEIDAVGSYEVTLAVKDSLQLTGTAKLAIDAIPRDDVSVQLSWGKDGTDAHLADLDLHLIADAGGSITGPGDLFCTQDAFVFNPNPNVFGTASVEDDPRFLRDDQGTAGQLESATLTAAPANSRFRVAVHYFTLTGQAPLEVTPVLKIRLKNQEFGPFSPKDAGGNDSPLSNVDDVWIGAEIFFPDNGPPTATPLQVRRRAEGGFDGVVGACP